MAYGVRWYICPRSSCVGNFQICIDGIRGKAFGRQLEFNEVMRVAPHHGERGPSWHTIPSPIWCLLPCWHVHRSPTRYKMMSAPCAQTSRQTSLVPYELHSPIAHHMSESGLRQLHWTRTAVSQGHCYALLPKLLSIQQHTDIPTRPCLLGGAVPKGGRQMETECWSY